MPDLTLVIGNRNYSSWSLRAWLALTQAELRFEEVQIPLFMSGFKQEIAKYSGAGKVPVLIEDGTVICESLAILERTAELAPSALLWPEAPLARAAARAAAAEMHAGFHALREHCPMNVRRSIPDYALTPAVEQDITRITQIWGDLRARYGSDGDFLFGHFTNADAMFAPVCSRLRSYHVALDDVAGAYVAAVLAMPAMADWAEQAAREAWVIEEEEVG